MIVRVHARWVVPVVAPLIRDGWIDIDTVRGEVVGLGASASGRRAPAGHRIDLGEAVVLPGLVNAHTHLELSYLAGVVAPADDFVAWVRALLAARRANPATVTTVAEAAGRAIAAMEASGTAAVGDIGNTDAAVQALAASSLSGVHFREALGFRRAVAARVEAEACHGAAEAQAQLAEARNTRIAATVAPHAPYSTSAPLIQSLAAGYPAGQGLSSIHLGESAAEVEFLATGAGPLRTLLDDLGAWDDGWSPPGVSPASYLGALGALHDRLLVVHGTQFSAADLRVIADAGATLVICPRSNEWVGAGVPPVSAAFAAGVRVALGTDSLASVADLNLFAELSAVRALAPGVAASALLRAATLGGAQALRCERLGALRPGASSRALVRVPPSGGADVEEWLVSGAADTTDLRWLDELVACATS